MRTLVRALLALTVVGAPSFGLAARSVPPAPAPTGVSSSMMEMGSPAWTPDGQPQGGAELGFAPLSVTQSGAAYSPAAVAPADPTVGDQAKIADLPAWASSYFGEGHEGRDDWLAAIGLHGYGALSGPAAWTLVIIGVALIGGALRGLIMANRRLDRLRSQDDDLDD